MYETIEHILDDQSEPKYHTLIDETNEERYVLRNEVFVNEEGYLCFNDTTLESAFDTRLININMENGWEDLQINSRQIQREFNSLRIPASINI